MRILMATNMYPMKDRPSYGIFVKRQVDAIRALGHDIEALFINGSKYKTVYLSGFPRLARSVSRFRPTVIHAHYGITGFVAAFPKYAPLVISLCGDDVLGTPDGKGGLTIKSKMIRELTKRACARADQLIVKSEEMGRIVESWGFKKPHVIPNGVDTEFFQPLDKKAARARLGLDPGKKYILFPHTPYEVRKRVDLAEKVVENIRNSGHDAELLVVYHKAQSELLYYYSAADLMLLTSEWEGSPNAVKETMACNLPSVSFDVGDVRWLYEGTRSHRVVPIHDVQSMTGQALELLETYSSTRGDGRKKIEASLSGTSAALKVVDVYRLALGEVTPLRATAPQTV